MSLSKAYPTQNCCNLRARRPWVRVQIPRQAEAWQPPRDRIPRQVEAWQPPENWVPGQVEAWWPPGTPGTSGSPSRSRPDNISRTRSLGRSRCDDLLGPPDWSWASPRSPVWPVLGRIRGLDIIREYFPPRASYFLVVSPEDCRGNLVGLDGAQEKSMKQEGRGRAQPLKEWHSTRV